MIEPPRPSSLKSSYPVIAQPPLFKGSFQAIVIVFKVLSELIYVGVVKPEGGSQEYNVVIGLSWE